jgi:hypothetical protein
MKEKWWKKLLLLQQQQPAAGKIKTWLLSDMLTIKFEVCLLVCMYVCMCVNTNGSNIKFWLHPCQFQQQQHRYGKNKKIILTFYEKSGEDFYFIFINVHFFPVHFHSTLSFVIWVNRIIYINSVYDFFNCDVYIMFLRDVLSKMSSHSHIYFFVYMYV